MASAARNIGSGSTVVRITTDREKADSCPRHGGMLSGESLVRFEKYKGKQIRVHLTPRKGDDGKCEALRWKLVDASEAGYENAAEICEHFLDID